MHCYKCRAENAPNSKSCRNCGKIFSRPAGGEIGLNDYPNKVGQEALASLKAKKSKRGILVLLIGLGLVASFAATAYFMHNGWFAVGAFVAVILVLNMVAVVSRIYEADYSSLPGARDERGDHRCIHCGNRGIWRRTPYATNTTIAACSKCKIDLYYE